MSDTQMLYAVPWFESERGWGIRSDGYSLHESKTDVMSYIRDYWDSMPDMSPDEYSRPKTDASNHPQVITVTLSTDNPLVQELQQNPENKNGVRAYRHVDGYKELRTEVDKQQPSPLRRKSNGFGSGPRF